MSNKEIVRAATEGRKVVFRFFSAQPYHEVSGYIVGMDDYHWRIASPLPRGDRDATTSVAILLVHKARPDVIEVGAINQLGLEDLVVQDETRKIGGAFWRHCERNR